MELLGELRVVRRHGRAGPPAAAVREQGEVAPGASPRRRPRELQQAEFHEVVAAAGGAELRPGEVAQLRRHRRHPPVLLQHGMIAPELAVEPGADAEAGLALQGRAQPVAHGRGEGLLGVLDVEDAHPHAAGDVHADRVGDHRVLRRQHAADRQAVPLVGVRHQRAAHGDRQVHGVPHLLKAPRLQPLAPDPVRGRRLARRNALGRARIASASGRSSASDTASLRVLKDSRQHPAHLAAVRSTGGQSLDQLKRLRQRGARKSHLQQITALHRDLLLLTLQKQKPSAVRHRGGFLCVVAGLRTITRGSPWPWAGNLYRWNSEATDS